MSKEVKKSKIFSFRYFFHDVMRFFGAPGLLFFRPKKIYISKEAKKHVKGGVLLVDTDFTIK